MAIAVWDDSYKTGNEVVDGQHQELFRMVNDLHDAIMANKGKELLHPTLTKLAKYTIEHFQTEEGLMRATGYPGLAAHTRKHEELTQEVQALVKKLGSREVTLTVTLSNFLAAWLRHHIKVDDMALVRYLRTPRSGS